VLGSSLRRLARTQPAEPAPTTMKSNVSKDSPNCLRVLSTQRPVDRKRSAARDSYEG